ncbi:MAG: 4Fe-4S dicluster domain-containing protein [Alphaproteobacteria bacterium]|nr:4Fe-4S dicluster domain-containing protein [Alphaproteobacteria bacterium]
MTKQRQIYQASDAVKAVWPDASGNTVNGLGETEPGAPRPVFWRTDGSIAHEAVLYYFYGRDKDNARIVESRRYRQRMDAIPVHEVAAETIEKSPNEWTKEVKAAALEVGADLVGICAYKPEWTYEDRPQPEGAWAIMLGFSHVYDNMKTAPDENAYIEVMHQYERAGSTAKHLTNWIRDRGHVAQAKTGPMTEDVLMIPAAIEAGLGELGKHGSMINRTYGSSFRLAMVTTNMPLIADRPDVFGGDMFCESCQLCSNACPPDAIHREKQMVRGEQKWYVDFDKCVPYFVDNKTCGLCLAVCPWSRPGVADNLVQKMAKRMAARQDAPSD